MIKNIPVYSDPLNRNVIGSAEIDDQGAIIIAIAPGAIVGKVPSIRTFDQLRGFNISYTYDPCPERKHDIDNVEELKTR